jgi:hypothetical protein
MTVTRKIRVATGHFYNSTALFQSFISRRNTSKLFASPAQTKYGKWVIGRMQDSPFRISDCGLESLVESGDVSFFSNPLIHAKILFNTKPESAIRKGQLT